MKKLKNIFASPYFIAILFVLKMAVYYSLIDVNHLETIMIAISLGVWATIFILFSRSGLKRKRGIFLIVYFLFSLLMFADTMYYNYYNQTVSVRQLWQAKSVAAVPASFLATIIPASFLLFIDIPFAYYCFKKYAATEKMQKLFPWKRLKYGVITLVAIIVLLVANPFKSPAIAAVNKMEFFTNHVNDICTTISENLDTDPMPQDEVMDVLEEKATNEVTPAAAEVKYHGIGEGKNLIVVQMEAFQDFVINATYNGQVLTPNLNALIAKDSLYFDHYFTNTGKGNTADAEFTTMNSLYPLEDGEIYRLYPTNTYDGLPWLLRDKGYYAFAIHGYQGQFWNRETAYPYQGFQDFYSEEDLNQDDIIGLGISDKSMFDQLTDILQTKVQQPFFTFAITLSNHHPFELPEKYRTLKLLEQDEGTKFGDYLETVHYTDEAIGELITDLKAAGLYDNTVIAFYGDHHGMNCGMDEVEDQMSNFIGRIYDYDEMMNIPLIIHVPGSGVTKTISTTGGQIDFLPTIANIMNIPIDTDFVLGQDLANAKDGFVAFTAYMVEGSFAYDDIMFEISRGRTFEGSRAWKIGTNEQVDANLYVDQYDRAILLKKTSREILEQNLIANYVTHEGLTDTGTDESSGQN